MGISYNHHKMIGYYVNGQFSELCEFLSEQGYVLNKKQIKEENFDEIVQHFNFEEMKIINVDRWSGYDYVIGYEINRKMSQKLAKEKFEKYFPNITAELHEFTELN